VNGGASAARYPVCEYQFQIASLEFESCRGRASIVKHFLRQREHGSAGKHLVRSWSRLPRGWRQFRFDIGFKPGYLHPYQLVTRQGQVQKSESQKNKFWREMTRF
jgi:hypothetical protein